MTRRPKSCVKCGIRPRYWDGDGYLFYCLTCREDPETREQVQAAAMLASHPIAQRAALMRLFHWNGGWPGGPRIEVRA